MDLLIPITCVWWYYLLKWDRKMRSHWGRLEIAAMLNAGTIAAGGIITLVMWLSGHDVSGIISTLKMFPLPYYIVDSFYTEPVFLLHHATVLSMICFSPETPSLAIPVFLQEIPIVPLNLAMWMLKSAPQHITKEHKLFTIVSFFITRIVLFPIAIIWNFNKLLLTSWIVTLGFLTLAVLNLYWFRKLIARADV